MFEDIVGEKKNKEVAYENSHFHCSSCNYTVVKSTASEGATLCPICHEYMTQMAVLAYDGQDYFGSTNISC